MLLARRRSKGKVEGDDPEDDQQLPAIFLKYRRKRLLTSSR